MSAGYSQPVQSQPQWQNDSTFPNPIAVVPLGLECLVEVEDVIFKDEVFQTKDGQNLFFVRKKSECCGPSFNLRLTNLYMRDLLSLYLVSDGCCRGKSYVRINSEAGVCFRIVSIVTGLGKLNVSIQRSNKEPVFTAEMPLYRDSKNNTIEILGMNDPQPVAFIIMEKDGKSSRWTCHFPLNMEAALKAVILGAFLYMCFCVQKTFYIYPSRDDSSSWDIAGALELAYISSHHIGSRHRYEDCSRRDWRDGGNCNTRGWGVGGDCEVGDWMGGGDCGGGGGWMGGGDCGGGGWGGGGDCGGGGGWGGGGDYGGGDCGGGGDHGSGNCGGGGDCGGSE